MYAWSLFTCREQQVTDTIHAFLFSAYMHLHFLGQEDDHNDQVGQDDHDQDDQDEHDQVEGCGGWDTWLAKHRAEPAAASTCNSSQQ